MGVGMGMPPAQAARGTRAWVWVRNHNQITEEQSEPQRQITLQSRRPGEPPAPPRGSPPPGRRGDRRVLRQDDPIRRIA